jgi:hypothetical protein
MTTPATDVIFMPAGAGAVPRVLSDRLTEQFSVRDYGAVGDGVADDSTAFVNALAPGRNLYVPPGLYRIAQNFTVPRGVILTFDGGAMLSVDSGRTVTLRGQVCAGQHQIFGGAGATIGLRDVIPEWFGAVGNAVADDLGPLQRAIDSIEASYDSDGSQQILRLSGKTYGVSGTLHLRPAHTVALRILGAGTVFGSRLVTLLGFIGDAVIAIHGQTDGIAQVFDFNLTGFAIHNSTGQANVIGVLVGDPTAYTNISGLQESLVCDVAIIEFDVAVKIQRTRLLKFERCSFWCEGRPNGICVIVASAPATAPDLSFTGDLDFENCQFVGSYVEGGGGFSRGIVTEIASPSNAGIAGIRIDKCILYHMHYAVILQSDHNVNVSDVWIQNCQLDGKMLTGMLLKSNANATKTGFVSNVQIRGNYFQGYNGPCITIQSPDDVDYQGAVRSISVQNNWANGVSHSFVDSYKSLAVTVSGNQLSDFNYAGPVIEFHSMRNLICTDNSLWAAGGAVATHFVQIDGPSDWYVVTGNNSGGAISGAAVQDNAGGAHKVVASNI